MVALAVEASALALATLAYVTLAIIGDAEHRASLLGLAALSALSALGPRCRDSGRRALQSLGARTVHHVAGAAGIRGCLCALDGQRALGP